MGGKLKLMGKGHSDELFTPKEAFDWLEPYLPDGVIFECAVGTEKLSTYMKSRGRRVVVSDDFQNSHPEYDVIVTNPPFSKKDMFLSEAYSRGKPFAILLPITAIEGIKRQKLYQKYGIEILCLPRRIDFNGKKSPWFYVAWFCWKIDLPNQLTFIGTTDKE